MIEKSPIFAFDDVRVEPCAFKVWKDGSEVPLEPKTFSVLLFLIENRGRLVEKTELLDAVWKDTFVTENAMTREIAKLRKVLGDDPKEARYIQTVHTRGYRFIAEVRLSEEEPASTDLAATSPESAVTARAKTSRAASTPEANYSIAQPAAKTSSGRKPVRWWFVALSVWLVLVVSAFAVWLTRSRQTPADMPRVVNTTQITTWQGLDLNPTFSPDGGSIAYSSDHSGSFEIYVKPLTLGAKEIQITSDGEQNFQPAWSPDGKLIAYYSRKRGGIWSVPASGGVARQLTEFGSNPAWSPDGSLIVFESYPLIDLSATSVGAMPPSTLWLIPAQGGDPTQITQKGNPRGGHGSASWSPDGKRVVFIAYTGTLADMWTVSVKGNDLKKVFDTRSWLYDPVYAPDGEHIYYGGVSASGNFILYELRVSPTSGEAISEPVEVTNTGLARIKHLAISADGKKIAYSAPTMLGSTMSVPISPATSEATGTPASLTQSTSYRKALPVFSPDGQKIAFVEFRGGTNQDIWVMDTDGKNPTQLTTNPAIDWGQSWFPDNDRIAFISNRQGKQRLWSISIKTGREKLLVDVGHDIAWTKLSPDGTQVAFNSTKSGTINVWTVSVEGGEPRQITFDKELMGFPCWSPDGKFIAFQMKRGDDTHVAVIPNDGSESTRLTFEHGQSYTGSFSPDGDKIAFAGQRNELWNIWWVSRTTKEQKQLTNHTKLNAFVRYPAWSPLGNQIIYEYAETTGNIWVMELK